MSDMLLHPEFDGPPAEKGWYPTTHCWDVEEGAFPGAHYWNGESFVRDPDDPGFTNATIMYLPRRFETKAEAAALADELDLGF